MGMPSVTWVITKEFELLSRRRHLEVSVVAESSPGLDMYGDVEYGACFFFQVLRNAGPETTL